MRKILIATADKETSVDLSDTLFQYEVHICHTGTDALKLLETLRPDILVLDLMLPAMDGLAVLRLSTCKPPTILARTNLITPTVIHSAAKAGVQDLLLMPCTTRYIVERLNALIEKVPFPEM